MTAATKNKAVDVEATALQTNTGEQSMPPNFINNDTPAPASDDHADLLGEAPHAEARRLLAKGFKLCELRPMAKRPVGDGWNLNPVTTIRDAAGGYGMPLAPNGLCSIDPDNLEPAREGLARCGFDLEALMDAGVRTSSTRPGSGGRSTFKAPAGLRRVVFSSKTHGTILELRAGQANLQDCLPGTVYKGKDGSGPYEQQYANGKTFDDAPELPAEFLEWWRGMDREVAFKREQQARLCGPDAMLAVSSGEGKSLAFASLFRARFNASHDVEDILLAHDYTHDERSGRYAPPTATGAPCVRLIPGKVDLWQSDHASDPLHGTFDAWTAHVVLDHGGDLAAAEAAFQKLIDDGTLAAFEAMPSPSREYADQTLARHGLLESPHAAGVVPLAGDVPTFEVQFSDGYTLTRQKGNKLWGRKGVSPAPAYFGDFRNARLVFVSDSWFGAASLAEATGVPTICVAGWAFGELTSEDGEAGRELHTGIVERIMPGAEVRIVTTTSVMADHDHRKRLGTLRVLLVEMGATVKSFTLPADFNTTGRWATATWGARDTWPDEGTVLAALFKGKDAALAAIPDDELAEAAATYTMSDVDRFGKFHLDLTDRGAGSYILSKLGFGSFFYLRDHNTWVQWSKGEWRDIGKEPIGLVNTAAFGYARRAEALTKQAKAAAAAGTDDAKAQIEKLEEQAKAFAARARQLSQTRPRAEVLRDLRSRAEVSTTSTTFDTDPMLLGVANGVVNLATGELRPAAKEDKMLMRCPVRYVPGARHQRIEQYLKEITARGYTLSTTGKATFEYAPARLTWLQRRLGAATHGRNALTSMEMFYGKGSNGKTILTKLMSETLGIGPDGYCANLDASVVMSQHRSRDPEAPTPSLSRVMRRRVVLMAESRDTDRLEIAKVKLLTGDDGVAVRGMYKDATEGKIAFTPILITNPLPSVPDADYAVWTRLAPFRFMCRWQRNAMDPSEKGLIPADIWFRDHATNDPAALEFFLTWLIEGSVAFVQQGLGPVPADVIEALASYKTANDQEADWMADEGWEFVDGGSTMLSAIYSSFEAWTRRQGRQPPSSQVFASRLLNKYPQLTRGATHGRARVNGIRRRDDCPTSAGLTNIDDLL